MLSCREHIDALRDSQELKATLARLQRAWEARAGYEPLEILKDAVENIYGKEEERAE